MCGIIGYIGSKNIVPLLIDGLKKLEYRGYDSAGIAVVDSGNLYLQRVKGKINELESSLFVSTLMNVVSTTHTSLNCGHYRIENQVVFIPIY